MWNMASARVPFEQNGTYHDLAWYSRARQIAAAANIITALNSWHLSLNKCPYTKKRITLHNQKTSLLSTSSSRAHSAFSKVWLAGSCLPWTTKTSRFGRISMGRSRFGEISNTKWKCTTSIFGWRNGWRRKCLKELQCPKKRSSRNCIERQLVATTNWNNLDTRKNESHLLTC